MSNEKDYDHVYFFFMLAKDGLSCIGGSSEHIFIYNFALINKEVPLLIVTELKIKEELNL